MIIAARSEAADYFPSVARKEGFATNETVDVPFRCLATLFGRISRSGTKKRDGEEAKR